MIHVGTYPTRSDTERCPADVTAACTSVAGPAVSAEIRLGEAALLSDGARYRAYAGEGGHTDFAPRTEVLFASIYGARAGNGVLSFMATGGIYLVGGIAPRIVGRLTDGGFMRAFTAKGRPSSRLAQIPMQVVLNDRAELESSSWLAVA